MTKTYINKEFGLYTQFEIAETDKVRVPQDWEEYDGTWEDAQEDGFIFIGHIQAGFEVIPYGTWRETSH